MCSKMLKPILLHIDDQYWREHLLYYRGKRENKSGKGVNKEKNCGKMKNLYWSEINCFEQICSLESHFTFIPSN